MVSTQVHATHEHTCSTTSKRMEQKELEQGLLTLHLEDWSKGFTRCYGGLPCIAYQSICMRDVNDTSVRA